MEEDEEVVDAFEYALAERLGMTIHQLRDAMSDDDYARWAAFWEWRAAQVELAQKEARHGR